MINKKWKLDETGLHVEDENGVMVFKQPIPDKSVSEEKLDEMFLNAKLVAEAPDLFRILNLLITDRGYYLIQNVAKAHALLEKIRGNK